LAVHVIHPRLTARKTGTDSARPRVCAAALPSSPARRPWRGGFFRKPKPSHV